MSIFYQNRMERFRFILTENINFDAHLHRQVELIIVLDGELTITVNQIDYTLPSAAGIIIFPNQLHSLRTQDGSQVMMCIFDGDYCHTYQKYFQGSTPVDPVFLLDELSPHSQVAIDGLMALAEDCSCTEPVPDFTQALAEGYVTLLLASIFNRLELTQENTSADLELVQKLLLYIDNNYKKNLSLELLAREFGVSRFGLSRLFSDKLHTTFPYYVNLKRLEHAKDLLSTTNLTVTQIALEAGFGSSRTFFREFREYFGVTPGDYRRRQIASAL